MQTSKFLSLILRNWQIFSVTILGYGIIGREEFLLRLDNTFLISVLFILICYGLFLANLQKSIVLLAFLIYFAWGSLSAFISEIYQGFALGIFSIIFILALSKTIENIVKTEQKLQEIIVIFAVVSILASLYVLLPQLVVYFKSSHLALDLYTLYNPNNNSELVISRATGSARIALVLFFLSYLLYSMVNEHTLNKVVKNFLVLISGFAFALIILYTSRGTYLMFLTGAIILLFAAKKEFLGFALKSFLLALVILTVLIGIKQSTSDKLDNLSTGFRYVKAEHPASLSNKTIQNLNTNPNFQDFNYTQMLTNSSGRLELWKTATTQISGCFFGCGFQSDRIFLADSVSNGLLYGLLSAGLIPVFILLLSILNLTMKAKNYISKFSVSHWIIISIIIMFFLRSLYESSFMIFGYDQVLMLSSVLFFEKFFQLRKKINEEFTIE